MASASTINQPKLLSCASQYTVDDQQIFTNDFVWLVCPVCSLEARSDIFKPMVARCPAVNIPTCFESGRKIAYNDIPWCVPTKSAHYSARKAFRDTYRANLCLLDRLCSCDGNRMHDASACSESLCVLAPGC